MTTPAPRSAVSELRERIAHLEGSAARARTVLPFGIADVDARLPGGGLALGALHEVAGGGNGAIDGAAAALFAAGIAARTRGKVLWCITRWLIVDGKRTTYRIHLGSGASQLAASGRHLCIVPSAGEDGLGFLPFEGDATTTLILSKAMLLAQDDRIEDPTILSQLGA